MKLPQSTTFSPESACSANCQTSDSALTINTHAQKPTARYDDPTATFEQEAKCILNRRGDPMGRSLPCHCEESSKEGRLSNLTESRGLGSQCHSDTERSEKEEKFRKGAEMKYNPPPRTWIGGGCSSLSRSSP